MVNIYKLLHPDTLEVRYVGKTVETLNSRLTKHICNKKNNAKVNKWIRSLIKQDKRPLIDLIEVVSEECWVQQEIYWIDFYKKEGCKLMNITKGGDVGSLGYKHTKEAKAKIGHANSKLKSQEWIKNAAAGMRKVRNTPIIQLSLNGDFIKEWDSFCFAAQAIRPENYISAIKNIHACCNKKRKTAYKFKWVYKNVELGDKELLG